jgi:RNA polymerase sporulation-specific sigma factor
MLVKVAIPKQIQFKIVPNLPEMLFGRQQEVHYIGGSEVLPPPLEAEEEALAIERLESGEEQEAKALLIEHNLRLVVYIAKKFDNTGVGVEDLISIGTIGLIKAINTFNRDKNIKLATYASRCIENEILMYLRRTTNQRAECSLDEPLSVDWDGNELLVSDILGTDEDEVMRDLECEEEKRVLLDAVGRLSEKEQLIINMRFGLNGYEGKTQKDVADALGISQSYISRLEKRILERLKREISSVI